MNLSERSALRLLVDVYNLQEETEQTVAAMIDEANPDERRVVVSALHHLRLGFEHTIDDLRVALRAAWDTRPTMEQLAADTVTIDPADIPRPWERYSGDPVDATDDSPDIVDLGADIGDDGTDDQPGDD